MYIEETRLRMVLQFPKGFLWGAASSATQSEGAASVDGKAENIWDYWYKQSPELFFNSVGPTDTSNVYYQYNEDIALMKQLGFNSFRTSISWSRLMPQGVVNAKAVDFYNNYIDALIAADIEPIICLYHFDMPLSLQELGGWENREVVDAFATYAQTAFTLFGDRVKKWITFNEPIVSAEAGYLYQFHYPCVVDMKRAVQVAYHTMVAHGKAVQAFKQDNYTGNIGIILNLTPSYPRSESEADVKAAYIADLFCNKSFLDPSVLGQYPEELVALLKEYNLLPKMRSQDMEILRQNPVDFLGINYYQPRRVQASKHTVLQDSSLGEPVMLEHFFSSYQPRDCKMNHSRGWEIYEKGLYHIALNIRDNYGNIPWYVSENGIGVENEEVFVDAHGVINDQYRISFIKDHLAYLHKGMQEGSNCFGYHVWTFVDNWSWLNGYKNRYGLYAVDLEHDFARSIKRSGQWFSRITTSNSLEM